MGARRELANAEDVGVVAARDPRGNRPLDRFGVVGVGCEVGESVVQAGAVVEGAATVPVVGVLQTLSNCLIDDSLDCY